MTTQPRLHRPRDGRGHGGAHARAGPRDPQPLPVHVEGPLGQAVQQRVLPEPGQEAGLVLPLGRGHRHVREGRGCCRGQAHRQVGAPRPRRQRGRWSGAMDPGEARLHELQHDVGDAAHVRGQRPPVEVCRRSGRVRPALRDGPLRGLPGGREWDPQRLPWVRGLQLGEVEPRSPDRPPQAPQLHVDEDRRAEGGASLQRHHDPGAQRRRAHAQDHRAVRGRRRRMAPGLLPSPREDALERLWCCR
mmetsp:Transcript_78230/g.243676  ORF Transcript_78230/g.243676 Transcript_78230/m.243676 type:complete len:246 (+) Transcript_78230:288-1025(+)